MYTYTPRTVAAIKADIDALKATIAQADKSDLPDMQSDLESLLAELDEAEVFGPFWHEIKAPTGGLDLVKVAKAFGQIPKDWNE